MLKFSAFQITPFLKGSDAILSYGPVDLIYINVPDKVCAVYYLFFIVLKQLNMLQSSFRNHDPK